MRKILRNHDEVAHFWANKVQTEGRGARMFFRNGVIYSYGTHFPIASHTDGELVLFTTRGYSSSTGTHKRLVERALSGRQVIYCRNVLAKTESEHLENLESMLAAIVESKGRAKRARKYRQYHLSDMVAGIKNYNAYVGLFGVGLPLEVDSNIVAELEATRAEEQRKHREYLARQEEMAKETMARWLAGEINSAPHTERIRLRLVTRDSPTMQATHVQTSWGAEVSVEEAKRLWSKVLLCKNVGGWSAVAQGIPVGDYKLTRIDADGDVTIGCHRIEFTELERIAHQLGLVEATTEEVA